MMQEKDEVELLQIRISRLEKKLKDKAFRLQACNQRIAELEQELGRKYFDSNRMQVDIQRAVQHALSNVRMIPVLELNDKVIVDVKQTNGV